MPRRAFRQPGNSSHPGQPRAGEESGQFQRSAKVARGHLATISGIKPEHENPTLPRQALEMIQLADDGGLDLRVDRARDREPQCERHGRGSGGSRRHSASSR